MKNSARAAWFIVLLLVAAPVFADWQSSVTNEIARSEYRFSARDDGAVSAPNRAHDLRSVVTPRGLELTARVEGESRLKMTLSLRGVGRGKRLVPFGAGTLTQDEAGTSIVRAALREWYVNDERGLEQGFTLGVGPRVVLDCCDRGPVRHVGGHRGPRGPRGRRCRVSVLSDAFPEQRRLLRGVRNARQAHVDLRGASVLG